MLSFSLHQQNNYLTKTISDVFQKDLKNIKFPTLKRIGVYWLSRCLYVCL